jgi:hypothetical protein
MMDLLKLSKFADPVELYLILLTIIVETHTKL